MITITEEQKEYLSDFVKNVDSLIDRGDVNELLLAIDDAMLEYGYDDARDNLTEAGRMLEYIYDEIFENN